MSSPQFNNRRFKSRYRMLALAPGPVLLGTLIACSIPPPGAPGDRLATSRSSDDADQCSTLGMLACRAMALLSSDSVPSCSVSRARAGNRVETCGYLAKGAEPVNAAPGGKQRYPVRLTWSDNSDNETNFVIERCDQVHFAPGAEKTMASCTGKWQIIATVSANTTTYTDDTAAANSSYIYRVKATNHRGGSGYTQEVAIRTPPP